MTISTHHCDSVCAYYIVYLEQLLLVQEANSPSTKGVDRRHGLRPTVTKHVFSGHKRGEIKTPCGSPSPYPKTLSKRPPSGWCLLHGVIHQRQPQPRARGRPGQRAGIHCWKPQPRNFSPAVSLCSGIPPCASYSKRPLYAVTCMPTCVKLAASTVSAAASFCIDR